MWKARRRGQGGLFLLARMGSLTEVPDSASLTLMNWKTIALCATAVAFGGCRGESSEAASQTAEPGQVLGGIDFQSHCAATGGGTAVIAGDWMCEHQGARRPTDPNQACRSQYPGTNGHAEVARQGDPRSWTCYAGTPNELGGMNLDAYCRANGAERSLATPQGWNCSRAAGTNTIIDMNAACRFSYPQTPNAQSRQLRPGNLTSWICLRP